MIIRWEDKDYPFDPKADLTVQRLRVLKGAFGPDYGKFVTLMSLAGEGDADSLVSVLWIMKTKAGESCDPRSVPDFSLGEFMEAFGNAAQEEAAKETLEEAESVLDPTSGYSGESPGSMPTSKISGPNTSSS